MHTHTTHTPTHEGNLRENLGGTGYSLPSRAFLHGGGGGRWGGGQRVRDTGMQDLTHTQGTLRGTPRTERGLTWIIAYSGFVVGTS